MASWPDWKETESKVIGMPGCIVNKVVQMSTEIVIWRLMGQFRVLYMVRPGFGLGEVGLY